MEEKGEPETGYTRYLLPPLPEVYDGSAKVRQEQEEIQNPSRAKIRFSFIELDLANVSGDLCFSN